MPCCSVFWCKNRSETSSLQKDNITFHLFPKNDAMSWNRWIRACGNHISWTPKRTSTICSQHFEESCFLIRANRTRRLKQCAVPTLKLSEFALPEARHTTEFHVPILIYRIAGPKDVILIPTAAPSAGLICESKPSSNPFEHTQRNSFKSVQPFRRSSLSTHIQKNWSTKRRKRAKVDKNPGQLEQGQWNDNLPAENIKNTLELEIESSTGDVTTSQPYLVPKTKRTKTGRPSKRENHRRKNVVAQQMPTASGVRGPGRPKKEFPPMTPNEKAMVLHVYKYLKKENDLLEIVNENNVCDLSLLCDILKRTADACGVTQDVVIQILNVNERIEKQKRKEIEEMQEEMELGREQMQEEMESGREWGSQTQEEEGSYEIILEEQPDPQNLVEVVIDTKQPEINTNNDETVRNGTDGGNDGAGQNSSDEDNDESGQNSDEDDDGVGQNSDGDNDETVQNRWEENDDTNDDVGSSTILQPLHIKLEPAGITDPIEEMTNSNQIQSDLVVKAEPIDIDSGEGIVAKRRKTDENSVTILQPLQIKLEPADIRETTNSDKIQIKAEPIEMNSDRRKIDENSSTPQAVAIDPCPQDPLAE